MISTSASFLAVLSTIWSIHIWTELLLAVTVGNHPMSYNGATAISQCHSKDMQHLLSKIACHVFKTLQAWQNTRRASDYCIQSYPDLLFNISDLSYIAMQCVLFLFVDIFKGACTHPPCVHAYYLVRDSVKYFKNSMKWLVYMSYTIIWRELVSYRTIGLNLVSEQCVIWVALNCIDDAVLVLG